MKNKKLIASIAILLLAIIAWYFYSSPEPLVVQGIEKPVEKPIKTEPSIVEKLNNLEKQASTLEKEVAAKVLENIVKSNRKLSTISQLQQVQNMPIEFYGKVIGQHGEPVSGVKVHYTIAAYEGVISTGPTVRHYYVDTDSDGRFSIKGKTGERIGIRDREKYGYEFEDTFPYYEMSKQWVGHKLKSKGSPDKPVIFHAWKKIEAEPLYYGEIFQKLPQNGQYHSIDIPALNKTMQVAFLIDPNGHRFSPLDWTVRLRVEGGGLSGTTDLFMNEAPEDGYQREWVAHHKKGEKGFSRDENKKFYFTALNGAVYGRMEVKIRAYYGRKPTKSGLGYVGVKYWINPNGSRNLQYDPSKRIPLKK